MSFRNKIIYALKSLIILSSCNENKQRLNYNSNLDVNKNYQVILMAGQSNMVGLGEVSELSSFYLPNNITYHNYSANTRLKRLLNYSFGPEVGLSRVLNDSFPALNFLIIKYAVGGSSITDWLPEVDSNIKRSVDFGNLYGKFIKMTDSLTFKYKTKPIAFLWMQGETDARYKFNSESYEENFKLLINKVRKDFKNPDLPVIYGKVNPKTNEHKFVSNIQKAQSAISLSVPNTFYINTDQLSKQPDNLHYDASGLLRLGDKYGEIVALLLKNKELETQK
ncbi:hypothetical protein HNV10_09660 [Winogradskyella litoriviva]|uniref:Sialate O-acetylesterase domain-containing protein n=1 Tax=Winogradskyella litoriviva TaxID=1220182 RepID=A0ABX2E561_9FLAO|nr:sialate O-acetylesterase [Winogradskyella litoriviva]NRD23505.1 hypothetical protein [Winogradskyella litoriviva]